MNIALWIAAGVLAAAMLIAGITKLTSPKEKLASRMAWTEDYSPGMIKLIGLAELLAAIGLILPAITGIAPILVPLAAVGLAIVMIGAIVVHIRRGEAKEIVPSAVFLVLALFIAWGRFGPYAF
ncbi:MAG: DoxX family protein [Actinomycetes bacterium]